MQPAAITLALGSGGARGCAHIGVIRGLETLGLRPAGVAGASMGALVGALYALGASTDDMVELRLGARIRAAIRPRFSRAGLLDPTPLAELVCGLLGTKTFAETTIPLAITAADLAADERVVLREGPIASAVIASMMVPSVFPPYLACGRWLMDPGIIDGVPVDVAAALGDGPVVAVSADLAPATRGRLVRSHLPLSWAFRSAGQVCSLVGTRTRWPWAGQLGAVLSRMSLGGVEYAASPSVVWIQPAFGRMSANHFWDCDRAILLGERAVLQAAPLLQAACAATHDRTAR